MSWFFALYCAFTVMNVTSIYYIYFPTLLLFVKNRIAPHIAWLFLLHKTVSSWKIVAYIYIVLLEIRIKQYLTNSCVKLDRNTYRLTHVIDNKLVKFDIKKAPMQPTNIVECVPDSLASSQLENGPFTEESIYTSAIPFLRFKPVAFNQTCILSKNVIKIYYDDGTVECVR